jgi:Glycosyl transferase family 2
MSAGDSNHSAELPAVRVSAVVTAHDPRRADLLRGAVASAIRSGADEVVVVRPYEGSLAPWDGRFRDVRTTDPTLGGKQADGVEAARGDVVAFLDDDDEWKEEKVAVLRDRFGARPELILLNHAYDVVDDGGRFVSHGVPARGRWTLSSNLALRRSWATGHAPVLREAGWEADEVWSFLAEVDAPGGVEVLDRSLTRWRYHAENVSRSHRTTEPEFRAAHARLYPRWVRAEEAMLKYAGGSSIPPTSPTVTHRRSRLAEFTFLAALENDAAARSAARAFLASGAGQGRLRGLAYLARLSPALARYSLYRFNRYH